MIILMDSEGNTIEQGSDTGPSNGYATTNRFSQPGSAYNNVTVVENGVPLRKIENGSMRIEGADFLWKPVSEKGGLVILTGQGPDEEENEDMQGQQFDQQGNPIDPNQIPQGGQPQTAPLTPFGQPYNLQNKGQLANTAIDKLKQPQPANPQSVVTPFGVNNQGY